MAPPNQRKRFSEPPQQEVEDFVRDAGRGNNAAIEKFLDKYVTAVDRRARDGWTALLFAAECGREDTIRLLLKRGAGVDKETLDGWTPLMVAASANEVDVMKLLLEAGADIDKKNNEGNTALSIAEGEFNPEAAELLIAVQNERELAADIADFSPALKHDIPASRPLKSLTGGIKNG